MQKPRLGRTYRHVVHLDSVIDSEEELPITNSFDDFVPKHNAILGIEDDDDSQTFDDSIYFDEATRSTKGGHIDNDNIYNDEDDGFYNMILNILDTFHTAAKNDVQQSRKRNYQSLDPKYYN